MTISEGEIIFDAQNIRWLAYDSGTGNVPAIGTSITQAGVSASYILGVYASLTSAPTTAGSAMPATGFIKFREVTGTFAAGALTGIGATALSADVTGWMEIVCDAAANITVPRLGKHTIRGGWFYLDNTNGSAEQVLQVPTNGGGANTYCPGVWIERSTPRASTYTWAANVVTVTLTDHGYTLNQNVDIDFTTGDATTDGEYIITSVPTTGTFTFALTGSGTGGNCTVTSFGFFPALNGSANGWAYRHIGAAYTMQDERQKFVKMIGSGQMQIAESSNLSATYANVASQNGTYATVSHSSTYTWASDLVTVTYATGHLLKTGHQVYLDFTSGDATSSDGLYTVTVIDPYTYTVSLAGSGTGGNVTVRAGISIAFTAHTLGTGDVVYCDFTSGSGVDGNYEIYAVTGANGYNIKYAQSASISGNVSVYSRYRITYAAHGLAVGNRVYLDFTSGSGVDGVYPIVAVATDTFDVVCNNGASADSGNVTIKQTIGFIPDSGLRTRIPNVFLRECATATRATNSAPNSTVRSRPEITTTSAGYLDYEYIYSQWYHNIGQAYLVKHHHFAIMDTLIISECASPLDIHDGGNGCYGLALACTTQTSNFAGGTIKNCKFERGNAPATSGHAMFLSYCKGTNIYNCKAGVVQYARSTGKSIQLTYCDSITTSSFCSLNSGITLTGSTNCTLTDTDHCDNYIGFTNSTGGLYAITIATKSNNIIVDGVAFGYKGTAPNNHPYTGIFSVTASSNIKIRNVGTFASPLSGGTWRSSLYGLGIPYVSGGNNDTVKVQRIYLDLTRTGTATTINSDKNVIYEHMYDGGYVWTTMAVSPFIDAGLNSISKNIRSGQNTTTGQASVYGTHFRDMFIGDVTGRYILAFNEPTAETTSFFTMVSGTAKWNSAGGILLGTIGYQAIWEDSVFRLGHTGFVNSTPTMSGATLSNFTIEYDIDKGSGYSSTWTEATGSNLSAISGINPAIGFKMKIRITAIGTDANAITYLRIDTTSTAAAQSSNLYPLDTVDATLSLTGLQNNTEVRVYRTSDDVEISGQEDVTTGTFTYNYTWVTGGDINVYIRVFALGYLAVSYTNQILGSDGLTIPVQQFIDRQYLNPA
jgi:hypothetical protein